MSDRTYNGWTNKETWLVHLWIGDNLIADQGDGIEITPEYIKELVELCLEGTEENGFTRDMLNCALGSINYREIAEHYQE